MVPGGNWRKRVVLASRICRGASCTRLNCGALCRLLDFDAAFENKIAGPVSRTSGNSPLVSGNQLPGHRPDLHPNGRREVMNSAEISADAVTPVPQPGFRLPLHVRKCAHGCPRPEELDEIYVGSLGANAGAGGFPGRVASPWPCRHPAQIIRRGARRYSGNGSAGGRRETAPSHPGANPSGGQTDRDALALESGGDDAGAGFKSEIPSTPVNFAQSARNTARRCRTFRPRCRRCYKIPRPSPLCPRRKGSAR